MRRTRSRPLPAHQVARRASPRVRVLARGLLVPVPGVTVNVLAATLSLAAIAFYVVVYTMWLKRSTTQNIVIGGAAGAAPALIGWAAVTGSLALPAWILFAIVFVWTPPHFWALALRFSGDYAAAGVPMLPVVKGEDETRRQIFLYSLVLFGTTLLLVPTARPGSDLPRHGGRARRGLRLPRARAVANGQRRPIVAAVQLLDRLPRRPVRRRRARRDRLTLGVVGREQLVDQPGQLLGARSRRTPRTASCPRRRPGRCRAGTGSRASPPCARRGRTGSGTGPRSPRSSAPPWRGRRGS